MKGKSWLLVSVALLVVANIFSPWRPRMAHIELKPEVLWRVGPLPITNTLLCAWLGMALLALLAWRAGRKVVDVPGGRSLQNAIEAGFEALYDLLQSFAGERARVFFPVTASFFLYILAANWLSLLPGVGSIGFWHGAGQERIFTPLLRGATADLNTTVALAACSVLSSQIFGVRFRGLGGYIQRFVPLGNWIAFVQRWRSTGRPAIGLALHGVLDLFVGMLEVFEELTKLLSFSFRLFGNIFGGEVLLVVIAFLAPYVASLPFLALEMLGGFIQAFIFAALSTAFFARAAGGHEPAPDAAAQPAQSS